MSAERMLTIELISNWAWRCVKEGILVSGVELSVTNPGSDRIVPLGQGGADAVPQDDLRHSCGGSVIAVKPLTDELG